MSLTRMTALAFLLLELSPFVLFEIDFSSALNWNTLYNISMLLVRNVEQDQSMCCVQE